MSDFQSFGFTSRLARAVEEAGYTTPTPIQAQAIPLIQSGRDVLGLAQTGTGKTLAFAAPILDRLNRKSGPAPAKGARVLVLAPTRELAGQIAESFETYGAGQGFRIVMVCGGAKFGGQARKLERGAHVLVATPGRLIDLMEQRAVSLKDVEILVLDEADQMLDLGFIHALRAIAKHLPKERQTLFFSATMPKLVAGLAADYLKDPAKVAVAPPATTAEKVEQRICFVEQSEKQALLAETIRQPDLRTALVFVRTKHGADAVVRRLAKDNIDSVAIHGNKSQSQRIKALEAFKGGKVPVLIATDIAARGIHIDGLTHVINFDLPEVPEQYVHRIGRTARAGETGIAISFVSKAEREYLRAIEKTIGMKLTPRPAGGEAEEERRASGSGALLPRETPRRPREEGTERPRPARPLRSPSDRPRAERTGERPRFDPLQGERTERTERTERSDRPRGPRREEGRSDRPYGDKRGGDRREFGDRPRGPRADGERRPSGDRPRGPKAEGERRSFGDRPRGPKAEGERRPFNDRPRGPKPEGESREFSDRPRGQKPSGERKAWGDRDGNSAPRRPQGNGNGGGHGGSKFKPGGPRGGGGKPGGPPRARRPENAGA